MCGANYRLTVSRDESGRGGQIRSWSLLVNGAPISLTPGQSCTLGRSAECEIVIDDPLVSRRHARVEVDAAGMRIDDLGSRNGVLVNGEPVTGAVRLATGDEIQLGAEVIKVMGNSSGPSRGESAPTVSSMPAVQLTAAEVADTLSRSDLPPAVDEDSLSGPQTVKANSLQLLGAVVDKALALGRGTEAEHILRSNLTGLLEEAREGLEMDDAVLQLAATYAVKLAEATGKSSWLDYSFQLYKACARPLPLTVTDSMYGVLRRVGCDRQLLGDYIGVLRQRELGPAERFAFKRLEGLARLAAL